MHLFLIPTFPAFSRGPVLLPSAGEGRGEVVGGPTLRPKGHCGFKCAPCVAGAAIALMQSDRDRCDISVPTHFHTTSHRLGVSHIPLLWSCPPAAGQHNDARMNLAIALTAARYGAAIANYTEVVHLLKRADPQTGKERVCGAHCRDVITGQEFDVRAKCVINATGPFTDVLRKMDDQKNPDICQPSAGVHIVIPGYYRRTQTHTHTSTARAPGSRHVIISLTWERMPQHTHTQRESSLWRRRTWTL
ncbi:glycerol-3-phosphate dehydrogenase, mitochondrial-like [Trachinotus anak]|uniref:glycerol-3-phosphate dehydrogenase, mitochondrial-like n=1 Tax=Trachinotus anak TaxID=443729 RepID=UPI0039F18440